MGTTYSTNTHEPHTHEPHEPLNNKEKQIKKQKDNEVCLDFYKSRKDNKFGHNKFTEKNTSVTV